MRAVLALLILSAACADHAKQSVALYERGDYRGADADATAQLAQFPDDDALWGMRVRAQLAQGDGSGVYATYSSYVQARHGDDRELLRGLATATLGQALAAPSVKLKLAAIAAVEQLEIQALADNVAQAMGDRDDRVVAAAAIAVLHGYPQAPKVAAEMLESDSPETRAIAVAGVAKKVGALAAADLEKAGGDRDPRVRRAAIAGLGMVGDKDAIALLATRQSDPDAGVRAAAAQALAEIGVGDLAAFGRHALDDKATEVRVGGVELLGAAGDGDALKALLDDPDPVVALEAVVEIEQLGAPVRHSHGRAVKGFVAPHTGLGAAVVRRAMSSPSWEVRAGIANLLHRVLAKSAAAPIAQELAKDPDVRVRLAAARVLAHDGDRGDKQIAVATFTYAMTGDHFDHPEQAAADLAELDHDPVALATLDLLVRDPKLAPDVRADAARAHRTARAITPGLVAALADANGVVRVEAATALAAITREFRNEN